MVAGGWKAVLVAVLAVANRLQGTEGMDQRGGGRKFFLPPLVVALFLGTYYPPRSGGSVYFSCYYALHSEMFADNSAFGPILTLPNLYPCS